MANGCPVADIPPLPAGFKMDDDPVQVPPLPAGFTLDAAQEPQTEQAQVDEPGYLGKLAAGYKEAMAAGADLPDETGVGRAETALSVATGAVAPIPGAIDYALGKIGWKDPKNPSGSYAGAREKYVYQPRSQEGQGITRMAGAVLKPVSDVFGKIGQGYGKIAEVAGASPRTQADIEAMVPDAVGIGLGVGGKGAAGRPRVSKAAPAVETAESVLAKSQPNKSMGAASAAAVDLSAISPELRQAIVNSARKGGGAVNPEVLARHAAAESLPVRMKLTEGQATGNPELISNEMNMRGRNEDIRNRIHEQGKQLSENIKAIRDEAGPDVFSANPVEHADTLISAYKAKDAAAQADVSAKYKVLTDANGGNFPVDAPALAQTVAQRLHKALLFDHAPPAIMRTLDRLASTNSMTFENFESLRTNLARIQRDAGAEGNTKAAAGIIRQAMEDLPLAPEASQLKPLADAARATAKAQFDALKRDPAYDAAVNDTLPPDRYISKYVLSAPRDAVAVMRENLAHDPAAGQTIGVSVLDHLKKQAGVDSEGNGNFSQARYNKALEALGPKLGHLLDPRIAEQAKTLGDVARWTQEQPRGSFVNNSNTMVAAGAEAAKGLMEGALNLKTGGIGGTLLRKKLASRAEQKAAERALMTGAGLSRLEARQAIADQLQ